MLHCTCKKIKSLLPKLNVKIRGRDLTTSPKGSSSELVHIAGFLRLQLTLRITISLLSLPSATLWGQNQCHACGSPVSLLCVPERESPEHLFFRLLSSLLSSVKSHTYSYSLAVSMDITPRSCSCCLGRRTGHGKARTGGGRDVTCWQFLARAQHPGKRESGSCWPGAFSAFTLERCQAALSSLSAASMRGSDNRCHFDFPTSS